MTSRAWLLLLLLLVSLKRHGYSRASEDLHRAPLPSPFDYHPEEAAIPVPFASVPAPATSRERQPAPDAQRPVSAYTVYEKQRRTIGGHQFDASVVRKLEGMLHVPPRRPWLLR